MSSRRAGAAAGFTLIELLVVVFVLALTVLVAYPNFQELSGARLRSATRTLSGMVRYLHAQATATRSVYRLVLDLDEGAYGVERCVPTSPTECEWELDIATLSRPRLLPDGVRFLSARAAGDDELHTTGRVSVHFLPKGFVEQAVIHLARERRADDAFTLLVQPIGGKVRIEPGVRDLLFGGSPS